MESQVEAMIPHLKMGSKYLFAHKRKGPFVAEYAGTRATDPSDAVDAIFLELHIYTEEGSGQERLARSFIRNEAGAKKAPPPPQPPSHPPPSAPPPPPPRGEEKKAPATGGGAGGGGGGGGGAFLPRPR